MNNSMRVSCKDGKKVIGYWEVNSLPGCPQVAVSNHAFINPAYRNQGYGKIYHAERLRTLKELGFNYVLCTVKTNNIFQIKILQRFGWKLFDGFHNSETDNDVLFYGKDLTNV